MTKLLCKLFRFLLNIFEQVVTASATALSAIGSAAVDVLSNLWDNTLGSSGLGIANVLKWGVIGFGAYFLFGLSGDDDDEMRSRSNHSLTDQTTAEVGV